jgi:hypothetical protein
MDWIVLAQDLIQCRALSTVTDFGIQRRTISGLFEGLSLSLEEPALCFG